MGKHGTPEIVSSSHAVYHVSKTTLRLLLQKFPKHAVDLQNDHFYALSNAKKRDIAPECLLRCRSWQRSTRR